MMGPYLFFGTLVILLVLTIVQKRLGGQLKQRNLFQVAYHHRHGVDTLIVESESRPGEEKIQEYLINERGFEPDREDEYFEITEAEVVKL